ncbi:hypothetical protein GUITHDRAFT_76568, partial [Guillardia theta CCMP2712]
MLVPEKKVKTSPLSCDTPTRTILHEVSGVFEAGKFTAIMGTSGAGKTTLLNAVAGEASGGKLSGGVSFNGAQVNSDHIRRLRAFVFQDDVMMGTMTVREAITMSARLRLPASIPLTEKLKRVEEVIELLHLDKCKDSVIGYAKERGISGGERKRVGIAMELITNPSVIFLDEPTSGLDSHTAHSVCKTLKELAKAGRTVVATIHQPSSDIFHMFDNLLILAHGKILYQGPSRDCTPYFAARGSECPRYTNPADHIFMKVLNDQDAITEDEKQLATARVQSLLNEYVTSGTLSRMEEAAAAPGPGVSGSGQEKGAGVMTELAVLFTRARRNAVRNRMILRAKIGQSMFMGLLVGLIYRNLQTNQKSIQDRNGALFFVSVNVTLSAAFGVISAFGVERTVFERERSVGMYSTLSYFLSKILVELPHNVIFPFLQSTIVYFLLNLQQAADKWIIWAMIFVILNNVGNSLGISIACMFADLEMTIQAAPIFILPLMLFSGLFVNQTGIPVYFNWIKYISPMKYRWDRRGAEE